MNIKNEGQTEAEFYQCANCHLLTTLIKTKILYSRLCLHRLCETCYKKLFTPENPIYKCNFCQRTHDPKDFSDKSKEEMFYEYDFRTRHKIMGVYYKRPEDFDSEDEYNDYLEEIEDKLIESRNLDDLIKDLEIKMSKQKLNMNLVKVREEINNLNQLIWTKDPKRIYNIESGFEEQFNTMQIDLNEKKPVMNMPFRSMNLKLPILREDARITIKKDKNLKIKAGGYNLDRTYSDLSSYAKLGLI